MKQHVHPALVGAFLVGCMPSRPQAAESATKNAEAPPIERPATGDAGILEVHACLDDSCSRMEGPNAYGFCELSKLALGRPVTERFFSFSNTRPQGCALDLRSTVPLDDLNLVLRGATRTNDALIGCCCDKSMGPSSQCDVVPTDGVVLPQRGWPARDQCTDTKKERFRCTLLLQSDEHIGDSPCLAVALAHRESGQIIDCTVVHWSP